jgi:RimJ/RimL family protein N-acetyltransferase
MKLWRYLYQTARNGLRRWLAQPTHPLKVQAAQSEVLIPIVSLDERHQARILTHLLELDREDRMLRFGYPATDEQVARYVKGMNFKRDHIYAVFNSALRIIALAHLSIERPKDGQARAEFGVSVRKASRGMGLGNRLFERAMTHARHEEVSIFYIHALSENMPMLAIAKHHGATLERDGSETDAYLRLPPPNIENDLQDWVSDQYGRMDYSVKREVKQFVDAVAHVQEIRNAVRAGRHKSAS